MLLQWIEVCSPSSEFTRGRYLSLTKVAAGILVVIFIAMEIITSLLHARSDGNTIPVYFIVYYTFAGLIVFATVPFYVIFGNHFRKHLESYPGASKDPSILKLKRKVIISLFKHLQRQFTLH